MSDKWYFESRLILLAKIICLNKVYIVSSLAQVFFSFLVAEVLAKALGELP